MKFKDIDSCRDLSNFLKIPYSKLTYILYVKKPENLYISFQIPKKSGGTRIISAPTSDLKLIQRRLASELYEYQKEILNELHSVKNISNGFEKGKSIITNAKAHKNKKIVINIDLKDFFESFHFGRVCGYFEKNNHFKLPHNIAVMLSQLTCYKGSLPQGAPTSPIIANLICQILDNRILKIAKKYRVDYTRYADDITFSTNDNKFKEKYDNFFSELNAEIENCGFKINESKIRIKTSNEKQTVTGLIVNQKVNIDHRYYKKIRAYANSLYKYNEFTVDGKPGSINQLEGMFSFVNQIDKYNNNSLNIKRTYDKLNGRERQFQKFLFYKYFWNPQKPTIITEGKTDILYIKAALKKLYNEYPLLVEKTPKGEFSFKINFIKRTKRNKYFLGLCEGADAANSLYFFFIDRNNGNLKNYNKIFSKISNTVPLYPTIFIFDNELNNNAKPLKKFVNNINLSDDLKQNLKTNLYTRTKENNQVYIVTNPLVKDLKECEIEDLFDEEVLSHKIDGRSFSKDSKAEMSKYYNKDIFSNYIFSNYKDINFDNFRPLLDAISSVINSFKYTCPDSNASK